jgi:adenosylhomocysteine nucleosidase
MNTVILVAIAEEVPENLKHRDDVFLTGVGKVNAALTAATVIAMYKPKLVINFGTAGGITVASGLHECTEFVQRDMQCTDLGFALGQTPYEGQIKLGVPGLVCSSGDNFVSDPNLEIPADVVDMEAYAIAKACYNNKVEFRCFKYVTDSADSNASQDWNQLVSQGEKHYINKLKQLSLY